MPQLTWLITGCSSGFGQDFVSTILARGDRVIATARGDIKRLSHLEAAGAKLLSLDVTASQTVLNETVEKAIAIYGGIDVLVNNAGYIESGLVEEVSSEHFLAQLNTNFFGALNVSRAVLPHFRQRKAGINVFVGSVGGWKGQVGAGPYCTSKFALEGMVECLQAETAPFGVRNIIFEAGFYRTQIFSPAKVLSRTSDVADYDVLRGMFLQGVAQFDGNQPGDAKKAVERMVDVIRGEGMAAGKTMPERLPLGSDCLAAIRAKCQETLKLCDDWEEFIKSTDL